MSDYAEVHHERDCLAARMSDAVCFCARAAWLDELVPRAQAQAEILAKFERWAREQEAFDAGDLTVVRATVPAGARELAAVGIRAADLITRAVWQRIAVGALNQRRERERRLTYVNAKNQSPPAATATPLSASTPARPSGVVELDVVGDRL